MAVGVDDLVGLDAQAVGDVPDRHVAPSQERAEPGRGHEVVLEGVEDLVRVDTEGVEVLEHGPEVVGIRRVRVVPAGPLEGREVHGGTLPAPAAATGWVLGAVRRCARTPR